MTNPYLDMLQAAPAAAPGGEPPANPYLDMLQSADEQRRQQMAGQLTQAVGVNPEQYTAQRRVAQYLGYPTPVVEAQPHLMGQAKVRQIQQDTANAPVLQRKYTDADFAKLAHDDAPILSKIETAVSSAVRYAMDLKRGVWDNSVIGTAGAFRMVSEIGASAAELVPAVRSLEASGQYGGNPLRRLAEGFAMIGANQQALKDASSPPAEGNIDGGVSSGFQSAGQSLKYLPLAFLGPAGWAAGLTGMVVESAGTTYQKDREEGVPMGTATIHAAADGLAEYVGERYFGEVGFLKRLAAGAPATKLLMWEITRDVPGEIGTTLWQNFNDWALTNPSKTADQFLREQPDAIVQTAIGTLVGGGVQVGVGKLAMRTAETVLNRQMEVTETLQREESLKALMQLAGQAKLAERSPEQLQAFVAEASGDATVRFDAAKLVDVFKQDANALAQALPSVDLQALQEAAATGGEVTVPLAELVVGAKAAGVEQTVLEHARLGDSTLSAAEARDVQNRMDGELGAQVAQAIAQAQDQDAARQSHEAVRSNIEQQITATGRHRPAVAEQMATWAASFFTTYGSRLGITAEEMYQRYPLRVLGAPTGQGGGVVEQALPNFAEMERRIAQNEALQAKRPAGNPMRAIGDRTIARLRAEYDAAKAAAAPILEKLAGSKLTDAAGQPAVFYHGSGAGIADAGKFRRKEGGRAVWFSSAGVAGTYASAVGGTIYPTYLNAQNPLTVDANGATWQGLEFEGERLSTDDLAAIAEERGHDALVIKNLRDENTDDGGDEPADHVAVFSPKQIVSAISGEVLGQGAQPTAPRGTFSPQTLELVLNPNANLSTWFHETGHFFLEVLADVASQPNAPAQIVEDMNTFLKWAGITGDEVVKYDGTLAQDGPTAPTQPITPKRTPLETWNAMTLDQKRPYHERWAESIEQYVMEGRAPSVELQPLMRRFAAWLKSVYGSIKQFLASRGQVVAGGGESLAQMPAGNAAEIAALEAEARKLIMQIRARSKAERDAGAEQISDATLAANSADSERASQLLRRAEELKKPPVKVVERKTPKWFNDMADEQRAAVDALPEWSGEGGFTLRRGGENAEDDIYTSAESNFTDSEVVPGVRSVPLAALGDLGGYYDAREKARIASLAERMRESKEITPIFVGVDEAGEMFIMEGQHRARAFNALGMQSIPAKIVVDFSEGRYAQNGPTAQPGPQMALNDDIRRVMDRMLATDEQIAQANEVAGLVPDEAADGEAAERLRKRSIADLKWAVKARDKALAKLRKAAKGIKKEVRAQVTEEVNQRPEVRAKRALDALTVSPEYAGMLAEHKAARKAAEAVVRDDVKAALLATNPDAKGLVKGQLLMKNKRDIDNKVDAAMIKWDQTNPAPARPVNVTDEDVATIADAFGFESPDAMLEAIDAFGSKAEAIDGMTEQRMLEEHGDLVDERAIAAAANEAVHNEARARSLATELRTQSEMLNARADTGQTNAKGSRVTVNVLMEAAKQFGANVAQRTPLADVRAAVWRHTQAERRAAKRWQEATAAGKTEEAVKAKQDQTLQHAAARALIEAQDKVRKTLDFFKRVATGNDETVVKKGRDADIVNAARAVLAAYGVETPTTKRADDYLDVIKQNDPETYAAIAPMVDEATRNAQPLRALTVGELQALSEQIGALWYLAKRSRQMEIGGDLLDIDDLATQLNGRMEEIGIPDTVPGEAQAVTKREARALFIRQGLSFLKRVEQWAEGMDGRYGGPFLRYVFQPIKAAADAYRADRTAYRKKLEALVSNLAPIVGDKKIDAPELGYTFGGGVAMNEVLHALRHTGNESNKRKLLLGYTFGGPDSTKGVAMNEVLHALLHTGNESNKRKLLLGRQWATENADGTLDTSRWDSFIQRLVATGKLQREHFDFVQGVWDLLEETKPLAQKAHRDAFGRYFAEVTAAPFVDPFGVPRKGGYVPAMVDPARVKDNALRKIAEAENESMSYAFPQPGKGFTMSRVEGYNRALMLDLRTIGQHLDKVLLFSHMTVPARSVRRLVTHKAVSQPLDRIDPTALEVMLQPWLQRSAQQVVETPIPGSGGWARVPSIIRARAGMALMFANVSNAIQQATGLSTAMVKVKPGFIMRAMAQHVAHPVKAAAAVWEASSYMNDRAKNEVAVLNESMRDILLDPSPYEKAQAWSQRHAYFLQTAIDNALSPIVWTGAYNQAMADGMTHDDAVAFADGTVRQTQGSTLPEDVSRFETGPAYARAFTQFIGYFNMVANTNATAIKQIVGEMGLKRGAGRLFSVVMLGMMVPIWAAEAIAQAFKGGPDDEDKDGLLIDDWLAAVFGFGTAKGLLAMVPIVGQAANSAVTRLDNNPMNDRISLSPGLSLIESAAGGNVQTVAELFNPDKDVNARRAVRDAASLVSIATGLPLYAIARPAGYAAGVAQGKIEPTGPVDAARGLITGTPSPESKVR